MQNATCVVRSCFRPPSAFFPSLVESNPNQAPANVLAKWKYQATSTSAEFASLVSWLAGWMGRVMVERQDQGMAQARGLVLLTSIRIHGLRTDTVCSICS
ncbi:hypothetical protein TWF569_008254 [Orbilia oligospora]|uniref:Uncharacterized protein n=1 Tax=Orbilia oligospora TaxID=2813651 RepID=A0A7C8NBP1_ORBOL|nr:hypothetical protein TWF103_001680 [Orbilia oligospora]KAF3088650.1 hypothetical protein TWF706_010661 [Orbilia oligospora]KAF3094400.1 hypothetical protein TWF102_007525 [Orbilia oligospora]KAF3126140.1 hypothetical protein TWF594_001211 [Orbilia oligospora]KAF3140501.1 hypothetical protein TWF569_008254 [Orbilia oligospora]